MQTCDDLEIAIERRLHGALGEAEHAALESHLASCASCRAYEASARRMEETMGAESRRAAGQVDWAVIERAIGGWRRRILTAVGVGTAAWVAVFAVAVGREGGASPGLLRPVALASALSLAGLLAAYVRPRQLLAGASGVEVLVYLRRQADRRLRFLRVLAVALPPLALAQAWVAAGAGRLDLVHAAGAAALAVAWLAAVLVKLPMVRRERADLGAAERPAA